MENMTPLELEKFSSQLRPIIDIVEKKQLDQEDKRKRGELFNVFDAFRIDHDELAWSAFLATLLDPNGSHGCGDVFLKLFLEQLKLPEKYVSRADDKIVERVIDQIGQDYESGGRIDIIIQDTIANHALIIENKIYAKDQKNQLYRYWRYAKERGKYADFRLIYLTLNGHKPSPDSTKGLPDKEYICISYSQDIKKWLKACLKAISKKQKVAEIIKQFIETIENTSKEMKIDEEIKNAIEDGFKMDGKLDNKIKKLKNILEGLPKVTNNVNLLLEQYQQDRFTEIIQKSSLLIELLPIEGRLNSYWCCRANFEHEEVQQIYVMHDWPQGTYCGVVFKHADSDLWKNIEKKCKMKPDVNVPNCLSYCTGLNDYDDVYNCLEKVLEIIK